MADLVHSAGTWLRRQLSAFFTWWRAELGAMLPAAVRDAFGPRGRRLLLALEGDVVSLTTLDGASRETLGRYPLDGANEATDAPLGVLGQAREVILCLPDEDALVKQVTLPLATEQNLGRVLGYMMDRHTPFSVEQVYYDFRVMAHDRERRTIDVELTLAPRAAVDKSLGALRALGLNPDRITVGCEPEGSYSPVNLLPPERRRRPGKARRILNLGLGAVAVALLVAVLGQPQWKKWKAIQLLEDEFAAAGQAAKAAEELRQRVDRLAEAATFLVDKKRAKPLVVEVLNQVTSILPDDTWLNNFSIHGREVQLRGFSLASAALIPIVEASPLLQGASFRSPVVRDSQSDAERFDLSAEINREKAP